MKPTFTLLLALGLLFSVSLEAQKPSFVWGEEADRDDLHHSLSLGAYQDAFCVLGHEEKTGDNLADEDLHIRWYSTSDMRLLKEVVVEAGQEYRKEELFFIGASFHQDTVLLFYTAENRASKKDADYLGVRTVTRDGRLTPFVKLADIPVNWEKYIGYHLLHSADKSKVAWVVEIPNKYKETVQLQAVVMNAKGELMWQSFEKMPEVKDKKFTLSDVALSNAGEVFYVGRMEFQTKSWEEKEDKPSRQYRIGKMSEATNAYKEINKPDAYLSEAHLRLNEATNEAHLFILSSNRSYEGFNAFMTAHVDMQTLAYETHSEGFVPREFDSQKEDPGLSGFLGDQINTSLIIRDIFVHDNGETSVLFEEAATITTTTSGAVNTIDRRHYRFYGFVMRLSPQGIKRWVASIPKRNCSSAFTYMMAYIAFPYKANIYLLYNEHPENGERLGNKELIKMSCHNDVRVVLSEVNPSGNVKRIELYESDKTTKTLFTTHCQYLGDGLMNIYGGDFRDGREGLMKLN